MKKLWNIGLLLAVLFCWQACSDSETLTPMEDEEVWDLVKLKEGNQPYDRWIKSFYDSTGVIILYDWTPAQAYWQGGDEWAGFNVKDTIIETKTYIIGTDNAEAHDDNGDGVADYVYVNRMRYEIGHVVIPHKRDDYDDWYGEAYVWERTTSTTGMEDGDVITVKEKKVNSELIKKSGFSVYPVDTNYISKQLELLQECFLRYYSVEFLKKYMPRKVLLGQDFFYYDYVSNDEVTFTEVPFYLTYQTLIFNWGDEKLDNLEGGEKKFMTYWLNQWLVRNSFWEPFFVKNDNTPETDIFDELFAVSGDDAYENRPDNWKEAGFVDSEISKKMDLYYYYTTVTSTTFEQFMGTEPGGYRNGYGQYPKCLQKYHIMRKILKAQGFDCDAVARDLKTSDDYNVGEYYKDGKDYESYYDKKFIGDFIKEYNW